MVRQEDGTDEGRIMEKGSRVRPRCVVDTKYLVSTGNPDKKWTWDGRVTPESVGTAVRVTKEWVSFQTDEDQTVTLRRELVVPA